MMAGVNYYFSSFFLFNMGNWRLLKAGGGWDEGILSVNALIQQ